MWVMATVVGLWCGRWTEAYGRAQEVTVKEGMVETLRNGTLCI